MTRQPVGTCSGCRLTVAEACAAAVAPALCEALSPLSAGLCALLPPDVLRRYAERWRPAEALALAGDAGAP